MCCSREEIVSLVCLVSCCNVVLIYWAEWFRLSRSSSQMNRLLSDMNDVQDLSWLPLIFCWGTNDDAHSGSDSGCNLLWREASSKWHCGVIEHSRYTRGRSNISFDSYIVNEQHAVTPGWMCRLRNIWMRNKCPILTVLLKLLKAFEKRKFDLSVLVSIIIIIIKAALATLAELAH